MLVKEPKDNDIVYCIKDVHINNKLTFKKGNKYIISRVFKNFRNNYIVSIYCLNKEHPYAFYYKSNDSNYDNYNSHFDDLIELRKSKLENIIKKCH